ncbi:hypothetical protein D3C86_1701830 [compost metagenome]
MQSRGLRPSEISCFIRSISLIGRNDSSVKYCHIRSSEMLISLPNMSFGASVTPM